MGIGGLGLGFLWSPLWILAVIGLVIFLWAMIQAGIGMREIRLAKGALRDSGLYGKAVWLRCSKCGGLEEAKLGMDWIPLSSINAETGRPYEEGDVMSLHRCGKCADQEEGKAAPPT